MITIELSDNHFHLAFPYSPAAVARARRVPGGRWSKAQRVWLYAATPATYRALVEEFGVVCEEADEALRLIPVKLERFKTEPFQHQREALVFVLKELGFKCKL